MRFAGVRLGGSYNGNETNMLVRVKCQHYMSGYRVLVLENIVGVRFDQFSHRVDKALDVLPQRLLARDSLPTEGT